MGLNRVFVTLCMIVNAVVLCNGGITSRYARKLQAIPDMPLDADVFRVPPGHNAPQQVHITQGDYEGKAVIISWITPKNPGSSKVIYWAENNTKKCSAKGYYVTYKYYNYTSGYIHHCTIQNLEYNTKYYYVIGVGWSKRKFWFTTPPPVGPDVPYTFGLIGDLGQTFSSNSTLTHYQNNPAKGSTVLYVGDHSYADRYPLNDNNRWDTWGRFTERSFAYQPWMTTIGNHDIELLLDYGVTEPSIPYKNRYRTPHKASGSISPFWYSFKRASAHVIVLSSYSSFVTYSPQYEWLQKELEKVDRTKTPWLIVMMHISFYNSYFAHYMEGEAMRSVFEAWFVKYKVDVVFAGHVHAYERSFPVSNIAYNITNGNCVPKRNPLGPVYLTVGDGGNQEGLVSNMTEPQPSYSAYREASFGHGIFDIKNRTHAYFSWHRNDDDVAVVADSHWFLNQHWAPADSKIIA